MSAEYWQEAFEIALDEMGLFSVVEALTKEQRAEIGQALQVSHEHYGMAHYSPPSSDRINSIEREWKSKFERLEQEFEVYRNSSEKAVKRILRVHRDDPVSIDQHGDVYRHGGRTEQIA